jgi:hypothetical protein
MRAPRRIALAVALLSALAVAVPALVLAATVQELVDLAQVTYKMTCSANTDQVTCQNRLGWTARITPGGPPTAQELSLATVAQSSASPLDSTAQAWMADMHQTACGDPKGVAAFVATVGALPQGGSAGPKVIGNCTFTGGVSPPGATAPFYNVQSVFIPPPPPTPTPKPTAKPTPKPTPKPTLVADAPTPTPVSVPTPAPSAAPSPSPSPAPTTAPTALPTPTPFVDAVAASPAPSAPAGSGPTPRPSPPEFSQSVLGITDVNTDGEAIGGSLLLALLMLLIIGFAGELFNNTVENNYDEISGWFRKGPLGRLRRLGGRLGGEAGIGLLAFLLLTALVSSFVDPHFGLDLRSLGEYLGFFVGLVVVLASFKLPPMLAHRRKTGELGKLRPLPWALVIALLFVLVSRLGNLQPGYLYAIVLGAIFVTDVSDREEGRETFYGSLWTLGAAVLGWVGLSWLRSQGFATGGFSVTLLSTACAAVLVGGLEATAFGLMPLRFMPGNAVYKWNRLGWGLLFGISVFAFIHILISPTSGYVSSLSPQAFVAALGVFAAFGALSIITWGYFRFRNASATEVLQERLER